MANRTLCLILLSLCLVACRDQQQRAADAAEALSSSPTRSCPSDMLLIPGGEFELGERSPCEEPPNLESPTGVCEGGGMVRVHTVTTKPFCIQRFPFPGLKGAVWPEVAPDYKQMGALRDLLPSLGRRLCDVTELMLASAGPENWRYPYHPTDRDPDACDPDDHTSSPMGTFPRCVSPFGVQDTLVKPTWGVFDAQMRRALQERGGPPFLPDLTETEGFSPTEEDFALAGGAVRQDTFYASSNFGAHRHTHADPATPDDDLRLCADPGSTSPGQESEYQTRIERFLASGLAYKAFLGASSGATEVED